MNQKGVSLIELIVAMVIITIGTTLVAPGIGSWIPGYRLKSATRDVISAMRVAQIKAVSMNTRYQVSFNPRAGSYILQYQDSGGLWVNEGESQPLPTGVNIIRTTFTGNSATFNPDSSATNGSVTLVNTKGYQKIISLLGTTGRIKHG
jgi:prepilin-type N-terminal cleavage/methylation domain-containing protein